MEQISNEKLVELIRNTSDQKERKEYLAQLYQENYLYFWKICKRYSAYEDIDDLVQEAFFGLRVAVERYDPDLGVPFVNYASIWVEQAIMAYIESCGHIVRFPRWMNSRILKYEKIRKVFYQEKEREPTDEELADKMSLTLDELETVKRNALIMKTASLDKVISTEDDEVALADVIPDPSDHYEEVTDQIDKDIKCKVIWEEVDKLKDNESQVIREYYLKERTLHEISLDRGCTQENVRQIRNKALSKLRRSYNLKKYADDYLSARAYSGTGLNAFRNTGSSAPERTAIERIDRAIQSHIKRTDRKVRRIEKKYGITLNQFRQDMADKIMRDMKA